MKPLTACAVACAGAPPLIASLPAVKQKVRATASSGAIQAALAALS